VRQLFTSNVLFLCICHLILKKTVGPKSYSTDVNGHFMCKSRIVSANIRG
jgi:hypothetical protein